MGFGLAYRMKWTNVEGQNMAVHIWDRLNTQGGPRPFNIQYETAIIDNGSNLEITFTFDPLPGDSTGLNIVWELDGTALNGSQIGAPVSPRTITVPNLNWHFYFFIQNPGQGIQIDLNQVYPLIKDLQPSANPLEISVIENDNDPYSVVMAKQAEIRFISNHNIALSTFTAPNCYDDRYYVTAQKNDRYIFKGFLMLDDTSEPFLSPRNEVFLKATDRLGMLKDVNMVKTDGTNPRGVNRIIDYITWSLKRTGLALNINVVMNIREEGSAAVVSDAEFLAPGRFIAPASSLWKKGRKIKITGTNDNDVTGTIILVDGPIAVGPHTGEYNIYFDDAITPITPEVASGVLFEDAEPHMYHRCYLDAKTFESEINISENCYSVLQKILGEEAIITQEKGEWWIKRRDESDSNPIYVTVFDKDGNYVTDNEPVLFDKDIVRGGEIFHINKASTVEPKRPINSVKLTYRYESPKELICNIDFNRGEQVAAPDLTAAESTGTYTLECWNFYRRDTGLIDQAPDPAAIGEVRKIYQYGYEKDRYLVIQNENGTHYFKSGSIDVQLSDKFSVSIGWKQENDTGGSGFYRRSIMMIRLVADNGDVYDYQYDASLQENYWELKVDPLYVWNSFLNATGDTSEDLTEWRTVSAELPQAPASGKLYFHIYNGVDQQLRYSDLNITYEPRINGSYKKYTGQYFKVTQPPSPDGIYQAIREKQVYIGDAPRKNYKGALLVRNTTDTDYALAGRFYNAAVFPDVLPNETFLHPYGHLQVFDVFNQFNRVMRVFRSQLKGLSVDAVDGFDRDDTPGLIHRYRNIDPGVNGGSNRQYHLLGYSQDHDTCKWSGVFREVNDITIPKVYDEALREFRYLEN